MDWMTVMAFIAGLVLLIGGGELLVRGASQLAARLGISPLVIGLTVVAYGTSAPELAVSVQSGLAGSADLAVGNVIGSNIFNVLFILGLSALITPLTVAQQLVRRDAPLMVGVSLLLLVFALDGRVSRIDGALLFAGLLGYTMFVIRESRRETASVRAEYDRIVSYVVGASGEAPERSFAGTAAQFEAAAVGPAGVAATLQSRTTAARAALSSTR